MSTETGIWGRQLLIHVVFLLYMAQKVNFLIAVLKISNTKADFAILSICIFTLMACGWVIFPNLLIRNFPNVDLIVPSIVYSMNMSDFYAACQSTKQSKTKPIFQV